MICLKPMNFATQSTTITDLQEWAEARLCELAPGGQTEPGRRIHATYPLHILAGLYTASLTSTPCAPTGIDDDGDGGGRIMRLQISLGAFKKRRPTLSMGFLAAAAVVIFKQPLTGVCNFFHGTDL